MPAAITPKVLSQEEWNQFYHSTRAVNQWIPHVDVVKFCSRFLRARVGPSEWVSKSPLNKVLDLGCGSGRHVVYFAEQGFDVSGIDLSEEGVEMTNQWLKEKGLLGKAVAASADKLPFAENEFEVVISFGVLDHVMKDLALRAFDEVRRVLKPGGLFHINLRSPESYDYGLGEMLEPGTYILTNGPEKDMPQHFWSEEEIQDALGDFEVLGWELYTNFMERNRSKRDSRWALTFRKKA